MSKKKDFETILASGTARQKALAIANSFADDQVYAKPGLTRDQVRTLANSIRTERQRTIYKKIVDTEYALRLFIANIDQATLLVRVKFADLSIDEAWLLVRAKFADLARDRTTQSSFEGFSEWLTDYLAAQTEEQRKKADDCYRQYFKPMIQPQKGLPITDTVAQTQAETQEAMITMKTMIQACHDHMKNTGVKIDAYKKRLKDHEKNLTEQLDSPLLAPRLLEHLGPVLALFFVSGIKAPAVKRKLYSSYTAIPIDKNLYKRCLASLEVRDYGTG